MSSIDFTFRGQDAVEISARKWESAHLPQKGAVQILHGAAEHCLRYERFATLLNANGYAVYANDHRGHGPKAFQSGKLGVAGSDAWNSFAKDARQLTEIIRKENATLPIFLFGHSMGSMLTQDYITRWGADLKGAVLCGTAGIMPGLDAVVQYMKQAALAAPNEPSMAFAQSFASYNQPFGPGKTGFEWLSRDEMEVQKYADDPACGFPFSNELAHDFLKGLLDLWRPEKEALIPKDLPILVISGEKDPVGGNTLAVLPLLERYQSYGMKNLVQKFYPDARHELLNEINREEVQRDILAWLNQWC